MKPETKKISVPSRPSPSVSAPISQSKVILAVILVGVMAFLWIRVILRQGKPTAATAQTPTSKTTSIPTSNPSAPTPQLSYSLLPIVPGRQDRLARDIFTSPESSVFPWQQTAKLQAVPDASESVVTVTDPWEKTVRPMIEKMVVDAIGTDPQGTAQAFLQDRFVIVGDRFPIQKGAQKYELTVKEIHSSAVVLEWQEHEITLHMAEPGMTGDK